MPYIIILKIRGRLRGPAKDVAQNDVPEDSKEEPLSASYFTLCFYVEIYTVDLLLYTFERGIKWNRH